MASRRYLNFDLLLDQEGEGDYQALVTQSPLGETPSVRFRLPFDATTLENLLLKLDPGRSGTRRVGASSQQQASMDFGGPLYETVFKDQVLLAWTRSQDQARESGDGLRLRLRLNDAPALAGLPWELLYDARTNSFLAQSERTPLVRFLDLPQVPRPISVDGPLRVLAVISSPVDFEELDVEAEWSRIGEALAPKVAEGLVVVDRLPEPTVGALGRWLHAHETHVIHFLGHGDFDDGLREGVVYFQDDQGRGKAVPSGVLGPFVRDHDPLRMVVLNACRSARTDMSDPYGGMAQGLVQQDATAVVAMQFPISDRAAVAFTGAFYAALVDGLPVDQATSSARKALLADYRDEWASPVLFMRSPDGDIFTDVHAAADAPTAVTPVPLVTPVPTPDPPTPDPPTPDPPTPDPPTPDPPDDDVRPPSWLSTHRLHLAAGIAGAVALAGIATVVVKQLSDDDNHGGGTTALPRSEPLADSQLLVAAGDSKSTQHIWVTDIDDPGSAERLTDGVRQFGPSLSPDRQTFIFSQGKTSGRGIDLMVAAVDGTGLRRFFEDGAPAECQANSERPAWFPDGESVVMACNDSAAQRHLVRVGVQGQRLGLLDPGAELGLVNFGDPSLSPDGSTVVVWGSPTAGALGGSLYLIDVASGEWSEALPGNGRDTYSDPYFSPDGDVIAFRGLDATGDYQVEIATVDGSRLVDDRPLANAPGKDQDPAFSPDGDQLAYAHSEPGQEDEAQELRVVGVSDGSDPDTLEDTSLPEYQSVPVWWHR